MKLSLVVLAEGKATGQVIPVKLSQFLIGRDPQCHLRPASPVVSKRHCALISRASKAFVRDFDSTNGTFVNDEQIKGERELTNGDVLKFGPMAFRIHIEGVPGVDKPTPLPVNRFSEGGEDDAAAMLLLPEEGETPQSTAATSEEGVPDGTTVMNMPVLGMEAEKVARDEARAKDKEKEKSKKGGKSEGETQDTRAAAAAILAKYARRQRT